MITLVNYGLGNIQAFATVYKRLNIPVRIASTRKDLVGATKLILPGVGAFDYAMRRLNDSGMRHTLDELVLKEKTPVMGICVGMQMLAESSEEGKLSGLGWVPGHVRKFDVSTMTQVTHLPHMGWNDVRVKEGARLFSGMAAEARFYFLHSYFFMPSVEEDSIAEADYGCRFCCAVRHGNIYGVQFHPEKSHRFGMQLLKNYAELQSAET